MSIVDSASKATLPGSPFALMMQPAGGAALCSSASFAVGVKKGVAVAGDPVTVSVAVADRFGNATAAGAAPSPLALHPCTTHAAQ